MVFFDDWTFSLHSEKRNQLSESFCKKILDNISHCLTGETRVFSDCLEKTWNQFVIVIVVFKQGPVKIIFPLTFRTVGRLKNWSIMKINTILNSITEQPFKFLNKKHSIWLFFKLDFCKKLNTTCGKARSTVCYLNQ